MVSFEENVALVGKTYTVYFSKMNKYREDLMQCGSLGLWKACQKFDESHGRKFSTFAVRCIKNEMAWFLRKELKHWYYCTDYVITGEDGDKIDILEVLGDEADFKDLENKNYIDSVFDMKNGDILKMYYNGVSQQKIADKYGVTKQCVSKTIKKSRDIIREKMQ